jgi:hypothetical protein
MADNMEVAADIEQQRDEQKEDDVDLVEDHVVAGGAPPVKGRKLAAKGWSPEENVAVIKSARILGMTGSEGEKDKCWNSLSKLVAKELKETESRAASSMFLHFKAMTKFVRSMSSRYSFYAASQQPPLPQQPPLATKVIDQKVEMDLDVYVNEVHNWLAVQDKQELRKEFDYRESWWNKSAFVDTRRFIWDIDHEETVRKNAKVEEPLKKLNAEQAFQRDEAAKRRRVNEDKEKARDEQMQNIAQGILAVGKQTDKFIGTLDRLVDAISPPPGGGAHAAPPNVEDGRMAAMELRVGAMEDNIAKILAIVSRGVGAPDQR